MAEKRYQRMLKGIKKKKQESRGGGKKDPWHVYIVKCADDTLYTGIAKDVGLRFKKHCAGKGARYTRTRLPLELVYRESCEGRGTALVREYAVKALSKKKKMELIAAQEQRKKTASKASTKKSPVRSADSAG